MGFSEEEVEGMLNDIWNMFDKDGNGVLDKTEASALFDMLFANEGTGLTDDDRKTLQGYLDGNGDGKVSRDEMRNFLLDL